MSRRLLIGAGVAGVALAVVLVLTLRGGGSEVVAPREPVEGGTLLSTAGTLFGDPMRASIQVVVDRDRVDPAGVGFRTNFAPFAMTANPRVARKDAGRLTRLVYSANIICVTNLCLSKDAPKPVQMQFPPAQVFYTTKSGRRHTLRLPWVATSVGPRTNENDLNGSDPFLQPRWRANADPFPVTYATSPHTLRTILFVASGLLLALGLFALVRFVVTARLRLRPLTPLERAVVLVERATPESPEKLVDHGLGGNESGPGFVDVAAK